MEPLTSLINSDALPLGILALIGVEMVAILWWQRRVGAAAGGQAARIVSFLGAGAALMAAMVFHRREVPAPELFALAMLAALLFHVWHLSVLLRR